MLTVEKPSSAASFKSVERAHNTEYSTEGSEILDLSVVIPAYNEASRLPATLVSVHQFLRSRGILFEILVVDDGSSDRTSEVVKEFAREQTEVKLVSYSSNRGKGFAVKTGVLEAIGSLILINDADGSSPISEVLRLEKAIKNGADLAIGSRNKPDDSLKVETTAHRKHMGNTFNAIVQTLLLPGVRDTQCGFKLFKKTVGHDLFSVTKMEGFAFDVEVLYVARLRGYITEEIAINWSNAEGSKVNIFVDSFKMLLEVLSIRLMSWVGIYKIRQTSEQQTATRSL